MVCQDKLSPYFVLTIRPGLTYKVLNSYLDLFSGSSVLQLLVFAQLGLKDGSRDGIQF